MVGEYESILAEGSGKTIHQEGYGTAFHAKETMTVQKVAHLR